jgi:tetratricopeptide (TPR) repeat protein
MKILNLQHIILIFCVTLSLNSLQAQKERPLLADVEIQKIFIDATKEKLLEHYQDAAYLFREVLKKDPENHPAAYELARMYDVLEEDALALKSIERAVDLAPDNVWYKDVYALILERNNKFGKAAEVYGSLAKAHPENKYFLFQQAFYYVKANQPEKAVVIYNKLEKMVGVNEELAKKKYTLYYGMGDNKASVAEIEKLINAFPQETNYMHILAEFYSKEGDKKAAAKIYKRILAIDPKDADANMAIADGLKDDGNHLSYLNSIKPIMSKSSVSIDKKVKELYPYIAMMQDNNDQELKVAALSLGEIVTQVHPQEAKAFSLYADMLYHAGQQKEALANYKKTLELDKSVFAVWEQIMHLHIEMKDMPALIRTTEDAMDIFPNQAKIYYMNGVAQSATKNHGEAASMFEQALMMSGKNTELKYDICNRLGVEYSNLKKYDRSDKMFERALEIDPNGAMVLHNYSYHLAKRGQELQKARGMAFKANEIKTNQPYFLANLGHIHFLLKNNKEAQTWLEKSMKAGGDKIPDTLEIYGDILYKNGDKSKAVETWQKAKDLGSNSKELERKISDQKL